MKFINTKFIIAVAIIIGLMFSFFTVIKPLLRDKSLFKASNNHVKIESAKLNTRVVKSESDLRRGLSGTDSINNNDAMLFVFPKSYRWGIWMKDMKYPIDIVWLDQQKEVVDIKKNAKPDKYPYKTFYPASDAKYVLEMASGLTDKHDIKIGSKAEFDL